MFRPRESMFVYMMCHDFIKRPKDTFGETLSSIITNTDFGQSDVCDSNSSRNDMNTCDLVTYTQGIITTVLNDLSDARHAAIL